MVGKDHTYQRFCVGAVTAAKVVCFLFYSFVFCTTPFGFITPSRRGEGKRTCVSMRALRKQLLCVFFPDFTILLYLLHILL